MVRGVAAREKNLGPCMFGNETKINALIFIQLYIESALGKTFDGSVGRYIVHTHTGTGKKPTASCVCGPARFFLVCGIMAAPVLRQLKITTGSVNR